MTCLLRCERTQVKISPWAVVFITTTTTIYSLGHGLHTVTAVPRSTQPSTLCGIVKAFGLSNNKWWWWMWMVAAYWQTHSPSWLIWSVGWRPPGAESAFIKWTGWTLAMVCHDDSTINIILVIIIRPHRSSTYVDAACCYQPSSMVCLSVCLSQ